MPAAERVPFSRAGRPLDSNTLAVMGSRFGHDFRGVRVHDGPEAAGSARALNALAYTVGNDVFFGDGLQSKEGTPDGQKLLAHELTHIVQQSGGHRSGEPNPRTSIQSETEAVQVENTFIGHGPMPKLSQLGVAVMRAEAPQQLLRSGLGGIPTSKQDVINAIKALIVNKFKGSYKDAFDHYKGKDGSVDKSGVIQVLKDADVSGVPIIGPSREGIAEQIIASFDTNHNGKIEWEEFSAGLSK
jgi:hypothetical protein